MSASLNTGERGGDDRIVLTASSHVTSPIHTPWGVAGQFYWGGTGVGGWLGPSPVCDRRVGQGQACAPYRSESDRVSVSENLRPTAAKQQLSVSIKVFALCVLIGHDSTAPMAIKMPILQKG